MTNTVMDRLTWKTAWINGHPDGEIWAAVHAEHFDDHAGALGTTAAAAALMAGALPAGGLVAEFLFCEQLERVALAAEIELFRAQRELLECGLLVGRLGVERARIEAARHRYVSDTMSALAAIADAKAVLRGSSRGRRDYLHGTAFAAMQRQPLDSCFPITISREGEL